MKTTVKKTIGFLIRLTAPLWIRILDVRIILMYHRVLPRLPENLYESGMIVTKETFKSHLEELDRYFDIVPIDDLMDDKGSKKWRCSITFDDGWIDNYEHAFPLLKSKKIPATIFLPTSYVGTSRDFWFERIANAANAAIRSHREKEFIDRFPAHSFERLDGGLSTEQLKSLMEFLKKTTEAPDLEALSLEIETEFCVPEDAGRRLITWDEVNRMGPENIKFGSHGKNHYILTMLDPESMKDEIAESLDALRNATEFYHLFFSYPNGNHDNRVLDCVREAGYCGAVTTRLGTVGRGDDLFTLNRIPLHEEISSSPALLWFRLFQAKWGDFRSP